MHGEPFQPLGDMVLQRTADGGAEGIAALNAAVRLFAHLAIVEKLKKLFNNVDTYPPRVRLAQHKDSETKACLAVYDDIESLVRRADTAMYAAKQHGRNRVCVEASDQMPAGGV